MKREKTNKFKLNTGQRQAVEYGKGPLLIIAGAGTGKTTVITRRIAYLIQSGRVRPDQILALTFTDKASREMEERVDILLPYGTFNMWISTFHAFCDRILRNEAINIGLDPGFVLMSQAESLDFIRKNLFSFDLDYYRPLGNPTKFIEGMLTHFSRLQDEDITTEAYLSWVNAFLKKLKLEGKTASDDSQETQRYQELALAYRKYEELKVKEGVFDFADLISNTLKLFRSKKNILARYQEQFKYILIDEFQDTNFAQNELAMKLAGKSGNITVVGDDDQAIYRWRGAAIANIIQFRENYKKARIIVLSENYRSTEEILKRSYDLIVHNNPDRLEVVENINKKLTSARRKKGEKINLILTERVEYEAEETALEIKKLVEKSQKYQYKDVAILLRANNHAEPFIRAFARNNIPFQFLGPGKLFRQKEVKELISYLKVLYNPIDSIAFYNVLAMDYLDLNGRDLAFIVADARGEGVSIFETCEKLINEKELKKPENKNLKKLGKSTYEKIKNLMGMISKHLKLAKKETAGQILFFFLEESGLLKKYADSDSIREERKAQNIAKLFDKLKRYETDHEDASIYAVVDYIDISMMLGESPMATEIDWSENNAVNLLTIHSAKGLEFPVVFLVNMVNNRFPTIKRREQIPIPDELVKETLLAEDYHKKEERRLFYVGVTRACDRLYLTASKFYEGAKRPKKLSPFISEILGSEVKGKDFQLNESTAGLLSWQKKEDITIDETEVKKITYLSHSQLDTFITCPLQYKYKFILRIPIQIKPALAIGSVIHKAMKNFYDLILKGKKPDKKTLLEIYNVNWISIGFGNKKYEKKLKDQGIKLLSDYYDKTFDLGKVPLYLEQEFKIKIASNLTLGGVIDRVDQIQDGGVEIIDYKKGKVPKTKNPKKDMQLTVYALAACDKGVLDMNPDQVTLSFYYFEDQKKVSSHRTKEELDTAKKFIIEKRHEIEKSRFRPTPGRHCDFCEFRLVCEAWK